MKMNFSCSQPQRNPFHFIFCAITPQICAVRKQLQLAEQQLGFGLKGTNEEEERRHDEEEEEGWEGGNKSRKLEETRKETRTGRKQEDRRKEK